MKNAGKLTIALLLWAFAAPSSAFFHRGAVTIFSISQIGINAGLDVTLQTMTNALKGAALNRNTNSNNVFDVNQYPSSTLSDNYDGENFQLWPNQEYQISCPVTRPMLNLEIIQGSITTVGSPSNITVTGSGTQDVTWACDGVHAGSAKFQCSSGCGQLIIRNKSGTYASGSGEWILCRDANNGGSPNDDCSQYASAISSSGTSGSFWTPEYVAALEGASPAWLRTHGMDSSNSTNIGNWGYRAKLSYLSWLLFPGNVIPSANSGGATNTSPTATLTTGGTGAAPNVYTAAPSDDQNNGVNSGSLGAWADGEVIMATPSGSSTSGAISSVAGDGTTNCSGGPCAILTLTSATGYAINNKIYVGFADGATEINGVHTVTNVSGNNVTIDVQLVHTYTANSGGTSAATLAVTGKSGGAKFIVFRTTKPLGHDGSTGTLSASYTHFQYNAVLDVLVASGSSEAPVIPYEAQINLANQVNSSLWVNFPPLATDQFISSLGSLMLSNLNSSPKYGTEYSNETWNNFFDNSFFALANIGYALGIVSDHLHPQYFWGLRTAQIENLLQTAGWSGGTRTRLEVMLMNQFCCALASSIQNQMNGTTLSPTNNQALCLYLGGTFSGTCSGAKDYSSSPNRPIDLADAIGYAPYTGGVGLCNGPDINCSLSSAQTSFYQGIVNNWVTNGGTGQTAAIAAIDADMRGTPNPNIFTPVTVSSCTGGIWTLSSSSQGGTVGFSLRYFTVSGGVLPSTLAANTLYQVASAVTGPPVTVTLKGFTNGVLNGSIVGCGTGGTGTLSLNIYPAVPTIFSNTQIASSNYSNYLAWDALAASYNGAGRPAGKANVHVRWYEGGLETSPVTGFTGTILSAISVAAPTVTPTCTTHTTTTVDSCNSMSGIYVGESVSAADISGKTITAVNVAGNSFTLSGAATGSNTETVTLTDPSSNAAANAVNDALFNGWRNDASAAATMEAFYKGFMGTDASQPFSFGLLTNSTSPANLAFVNSPTWGLYPSVPTSSIVTGVGVNQTPWQLYNGIANFNRGM